MLQAKGRYHYLWHKLATQKHVISAWVDKPFHRYIGE